MSKTRLKPQLGMNSWDEVNEGLQRLGELQGDKETREAVHNAGIEKAKAAMKAELDPIQDRMNDLAKDIYLYALGNQKTLIGRSKKLLHGLVAFHKSTVLSLPKDVIEKLKAAGRDDLIQTKETVDKVGLKKCKALIQIIGAALKPKDSFRIELPEHKWDFDKKLKVVKS